MGDGDVELARRLSQAGVATVALVVLDGVLAASPASEAARELRIEVAPVAERQLRDMALFELNEGDARSAVALARRAVAAEQPPSASTLAVLAECLAASGQLDEAVALATNALDVAPANDRARRLLTRLGR